MLNATSRRSLTMQRTLLPLVALAGLAAAIPAGHWVNTWVAMPQLTEYSNVPNPPFVCLTQSMLPITH